MANNFANTSWVSMKVLALLLNQLVVTEQFNRDTQADFDKDFAPGSTVTRKFPQLYKPIDGMGYVPQAINRLTTTVALDQWIQVPWEFDDYERAVKLERSEEELSKNYWEPAASAIAQEWDSRAALFAKNNASNVVGTLGTSPTSADVYLNAQQLLIQEGCQMNGEIRACISAEMSRKLINSGMLGSYNPQDSISRAFKEGSLGELKIAGFDVYRSNSLYSHTAGTWAGAVTVTGAGQSGGSIVITGTNGDTIKQGDKIASPT
jgi:P22 coat protein - gene protein 5